MHTQKRQKLFFSALIALMAFTVSIGVYAEHNDEHEVKKTQQAEKKVEKTLVKMEKKLDSFENRLESAWDLNDGNKRAVTMQHDGSYRVSGVKIASVNASSSMLTVEFFGFTREVSVAGAKIIGGGRHITLADFQAGDMLSGSGTFDSSTRVIVVKEVHNLSYRHRASTEINARIQALLNQIKKLQERIEALRR